MPDIEMIEETLFDQYITYCRDNGQTPSLSDYTVWLEEFYD